MAQGDIVINMAGNLTGDPELRFTTSGQAVASFTVVCSSRRLNRETDKWEDSNTVFMRCTAWRQMAENIAEGLKKGDRVMVQGILKQQTYDTREGEKRTVLEVTADDIGPSFKWKGGTVDRVQREGGGQQSRQQQPANDDPWASPPPYTASGFSDEPPF